MKSEPRSYQETGAKAVMRAFQVGNRAQINMASGTGKTLLAIRVWEKTRAQRTVVFVPSIALARQIAEVWLDESDEPPAIVALMSRKLGIVPSTSNIDRLKDLLREYQREGRRVIVISTYHSSAKLSAMSFDLAIYDEAHRTAAITIPGVKPMYAATLNGSMIRCKNRLFMTATTKINPKADDLRREGFKVFSMDESTYGEMVYTYAPSAALADGVLAPFRIVVPVVTDGEVAAAMGRCRTKTAGKKASVDDVAAYIGLSKTLKKYGCKKAFAFTRTIAQTRQFAGDTKGRIGFCDIHDDAPEVFAVWGDLRGYALSERLSRFGSLKKAIMANPRSLVEGVDVPDVDCVAFLSPRKGELLIAQAIGRLLRRVGNKVGTIVCPLYCPGNAVRSAHVDAILSVVEMMRSAEGALLVEAGAKPATTSGHQGLSYLAPESFPLVKLRRAVFLRELHQGKIVIDEETIAGAVRKYIAKHGEVPTGKSGDAEPYLGLPMVWKTLVERSRREGRSWREWLVEKGFLASPIHLTENNIVAAAKAFGVAHRTMPRMDSGDASAFFPFEIRWVNVERALRRGHLGLPGGSTLSVLLRKRGLRAPKGVLTRQGIAAACKTFYREHARWPAAKPVGDASLYIGEPKGSTNWRAIDVALREGWRGLKAGSTLMQLCKGLERPLPNKARKRK